MNKNLKISFYLYNFVLFCFFVVACVYMSRSEFMPYHSVAVNMKWSEVPANFQILILAGIHAVGSLIFTIFSAIAIILYIPFKQKAIWAKYAVGVLSLLLNFSLIYVVIFVKNNTNAHPPFIPLLVLLSIILIAFFLSFRKN